MHLEVLPAHSWILTYYSEVAMTSGGFLEVMVLLSVSFSCQPHTT